MDLNEVLTKNKINFKEIEYDEKVKIYKTGKISPINIVVIFDTSNTFKIDRDLIFYLGNQTINYSFFLINRIENDMFYLEFNNKNNWLQSSFNRSDKDVLYFGKIVLNHRIKENEILLKLLKY